ncbi:MAG: Hsp20/alpha crystallin family protein [Alkalibacterium sp.]|nr:Hsp20/alpha crystallin family protein [Alkalibacterium sp.]TVP93339.1 MAG: Hsp20/alpha crystallin family protein [Alkalibacterium sp.]
MNDMIPSKRDFWDLSRRFFDDALGQNFGDFGSFKTDIIEQDDAYVVEAELPGMSRENIELDFQDNILSISAKQETATDESDEERNYIRRERSTRSFSRQFILQDIDEDNIKARFDNGILEVTLPKQHPEPKNTKKIDIE